LPIDNENSGERNKEGKIALIGVTMSSPCEATYNLIDWLINTGVKNIIGSNIIIKREKQIINDVRFLFFILLRKRL
jgi:hypothetical protein